MTAFTTLKMAVLAPMPRASMRMATAVKPGFFRSISWRLRLQICGFGDCSFSHGFHKFRQRDRPGTRLIQIRGGVRLYVRI